MTSVHSASSFRLGDAAVRMAVLVSAIVLGSHLALSIFLRDAATSQIDLLVAVFDGCVLAVVTAALVKVLVANPFVKSSRDAEQQLDRALRTRGEQLAELAAALAQQSAHKLVLDRHAIVSETDVEGRITYVNDEFTRATGYSRAEVIGANYRIVNSGVHPPEFWRDMYDTMAAGAVWQGEVCNKRKDGSHYWVQATNSAIKDENGKIIGFVSLRIDITQAKFREQALKAAQEQLLQATAKAEAASIAKSNFLSTMSHEMRTPLNGVLGALDLLRETGLDEPQRELVSIAHESGDALLVHINDVLDFSKMEAGKLDLEVAPFDLAWLVTSVQHIVMPQADSLGNRIEADLVGELPTKLNGDRIRVRQVLLNLVSNANKFTRNGSVSVRVEQIGGTRERPDIEFSVTDTGIGIPEERLKDLFQEFSMLDSSYTRKTSGTGLGLAISKRLIEAMGGTIGVESTAGVGSRFWFRLALEGIWCARSEVVEQTQLAANGAPRLKILLADDNVTNQLVATRMLEASGHEVFTVDNGRQALQAASTQRFDVLLTDISMPEMDGIEATKQIRALPEPYCSLPIVALTANAISGDRERFLGAGMNEYLTKPLRRADLDQCLAHLFIGKGTVAQESSDKPAAESTAEAPLLDPTELEELAEQTSPDVVPIVVDEYLSEMKRRLDEVLAAMQARDLDQLMKISHAIAGASASAGALRLRFFAKDIELGCKAGERDQAFMKAIAYPDLIADTEHAYREHLAGGKTMPANQLQSKSNSGREAA